MTALSRAIATWQKLPASARNNALQSLRDNITQLDSWMRHEDAMGRGDEECFDHRRDDAAAIRAALGVLLAVSKPVPRVTRADCDRLLRKSAALQRSNEAMAKRVDKMRARFGLESRSVSSKKRRA